MTLDVPPPHDNEPKEPEDVEGWETPTHNLFEDPVEEKTVTIDPISCTSPVVETVTEEAATGPATDTAEATAPMDPRVPPPNNVPGGMHPGPYSFSDGEEEDAPAPAARQMRRSRTVLPVPAPLDDPVDDPQDNPIFRRLRERLVAWYAGSGGGGGTGRGGTGGTEGGRGRE